MEVRRDHKARIPVAALLLASGVASGLAWIVSAAVVQNAQRHTDVSDPSTTDAAIESTRWFIVAEFVAMPLFFASFGVYVLAWFLRRQRK